MGANIAADGAAKTDGWPGYPAAPEIAHEPHVIGSPQIRDTPPSHALAWSPTLQALVIGVNEPGTRGAFLLPRPGL